MTVDLRRSLPPDGVEQLHGLYGGEWWTSDRDLDDVRRMLEHTDEVFVLWDDATDEIVGFARVLSDYVYKALIFDMIVAPDRRGEGLGRRLMDALLSDSAFDDIDRFELYCRGKMVPFYEQWGFTDDTGGSRLMRREAPADR